MQINIYAPSLKEELKTLPDCPTDAIINNMVASIGRFEESIQKAIEMRDNAVRELAVEINEDWTKEEILKTGLRANHLFMKEIN